MAYPTLRAFILWTLLAVTAGPLARGDVVFFPGNSLAGWTVRGEDIWRLSEIPGGKERCYGVTSRMLGEEKTGRLVSPPFTLAAPIQRFLVAGADGTKTGRNDGDMNFIVLRSWPDGEELRRMRPPGTHIWQPAQWLVPELMGRKVCLELVDGNPRLRDDGFAWIGLGHYEQYTPELERPVETDALSGLNIDNNAKLGLCRSLPFLVSDPRGRGGKRVIDGETETLPVGATAKTLYLLGMINQGWDWGVAHWGEHPELNEKNARPDQTQIGVRIGDLELHYADGNVDTIPLVLGSTAWYYNNWVYGTSHGVKVGCREPIASRPDAKAAFKAAFKLAQAEENLGPHAQFYLAVKPRARRIESIVLRDNPEKRGRPMVTAVTLRGAEGGENLKPLGAWTVDEQDLEPRVDVAKPVDYQRAAKALADVLYMSEADLPASVALLPFPEDLDATRIRFLGGVKGDMLTNVWTANLQLIDEKFPADTGVFWESVPKIGPWYGGYNGFGTWAPVGVYWGENTAFARCSDHYATLALRLIHNDRRLTHFVDFVDHWLYFFRHDHDPANGPDNQALDLGQYPEGAYPNWAFVFSNPMGMPLPIDPVPGDQETGGHGATMVARWVAWRNLGAPRGDWLTAPRNNVFGKSRWDSTKDAAEFICWYLDYTGMDVLFTEGETTGWAAGGADAPLGLIPGRPADAKDMAAVRRFYANANMYEPYPTWVGQVALRCSADLAEAVGDTASAERWRAYAQRLRDGMLRLLRVGDHRKLMWRVSPNSVYPSLQDSLVQAWFAFYRDGYDPTTWDPQLTPITYNTLDRQLDQPYGHAPVLAMGYGQGWLTKAALLLDEMDDAGPLLWNIAKYSYDKNMDFVDEERGIDWRRWLYIIPEGTNILPDGRWYRIGDLSNGANEGPAMHALEICAGVDDTQPRALKIMPRVPDPLTGIEVANHFTLVPGGDGLKRARVAYTYHRDGRFTLKSDVALPSLAVRLGPFTEDGARAFADGGKFPKGAAVRSQASGHHGNGVAWWVWVSGMKDVRSVGITPK